ncbi:MAG: TIGR03089 family protein [Actinomycetota bacterium]
MTSPEALFGAVLAAEPARPVVTFYDETSSERSELSARSMANWVAKTHFLLTDTLGLGVGDVAQVALPAHWISVAALLGCWSAGLEVSTDPARAHVAFVEPGTLGEAQGVPDVFVIAPGAAARGFGTAPPGHAEDYVAAVRPQPDAWASVQPLAGPDDRAIEGRSRAEVVAAARAFATSHGWPRGVRVLTGRSWHGTQDWIETVLAPLAMTGSLVIVRNATAQLLERRREQERATAVL